MIHQRDVKSDQSKRVESEKPTELSDLGQRTNRHWLAEQF